MENSSHTKITEEATLGAGCFWCVEAVFKELKGVLQVEPGYAGGHVQNPTYKEICTGRTGHAEVVRVMFDNSVIPFAKILEVFWAVHDPTTKDRQGGDIGTQYRSVVFFHNKEQQAEALKIKAQLDASKAFNAPLVTEVVPLSNYSKAEGYHHDYFALNGSQPYCQMVVRPKLEKFRMVFNDLLRTNGGGQ